MRPPRYPSLLRRSLTAAALLAVPLAAQAQPNINGTCDPTEYGNHEYVSSGVTYRMTWTNSNLYICANPGDTRNPIVVYFDVNPSIPVNGGTGTTSGLNYDGVTPTLPFSSDAVIYVKATYRELRRESGGSFGSQEVAFGEYSNSGGSHEIRIPWANLTGDASRPISFNFFAYHNNEGQNNIFASIPVENPPNGAQSSPQMVRYFTVPSTGASPSQSPFANNSYTNISSDLNFGEISVYDFTLNTGANTITRTAGTNWTIGRNLVVGAGTLNFNTGTTSATNLVVSGGTPTTLAAENGVVTVTGDLNASAGMFTVGQADRLVLASSVGSVATVSSDAGISGDYTSRRTFTATNGWRTVGVPFGSQTVASLSNEVHLQGFDDLRPGPTNRMLYTYDPEEANANAAEGAEAFVRVPTTTTGLTPGDGYLMYVFANRNPTTGVQEAAAARTWEIAGRETPDASITKNLPNSEVSRPNSAFHLVANPYAGDLDWNQIGKVNLSTTYQVVNPAGQFVAYTQGAGDYPGRYIAPYTGFFVEAVAPATTTSITFDKSQKVNAGVPTVLGKNETTVALFDVSVRGEALESSPVRFAFADDGAAGRDRWDASLLPALTQQYAQIAIVSGGRSLIVEGRSYLTGDETYALRFSTTKAGQYEIGASAFVNVPDAWGVRLIDGETGRTADLRSGSYAFTAAEGLSNRFTLVVSPGRTTSAEGASALRFAVSEPMPNPARGTVRMRVTAASAGAMSVEVYDVLGRRVQTAALDGMAAGQEQTVTLDVSALPSGTYLVRVSGADGSVTRRVTVAR